MSKLFETVKILHIESSDVCQAECPSCLRETDKNFDKTIRNNLQLWQFKKLVPDNLIQQLDKLFLCGNYGDPAANAESKTILSYVRQINSSTVLGMNTNGGLQNKSWWAELAKTLYRVEDYVVFSIDGLADTNHIYRINVDWQMIMRNAESFINAGGNAQWDMLVYEHNEHQIEKCQQLAKDMGFKWFRAKVSRREPTVNWLKKPKGWQRPVINQGTIKCFRDNEQSIYLNSHGVYFPCCWLGQSNYTIDKFNQIEQSWDTPNCNPICKETCSTINNESNYTNQWQIDIQLC